MQLMHDFRHTQQQFTAHIRDPDTIAKPVNIESRRMAIYHRLVYNNVEGFLSSACPVSKQILGESFWHALVHDFIRKHRCASPLFRDIAREFVNYLDKHPQQYSAMPFLAQLAHYEWVELALDIAHGDFQKRNLTVHDNILQLSLHRSPLSWSFAYDYPVHQIDPENLPDKAADIPYFLLLYRNEADEVKFIELNAVSARLLDLLDAGLTGLQATNMVVETLRHPEPNVVISGAKQLISDWLERGIVI